MTRNEIKEKMKAYGIKHYLISYEDFRGIKYIVNQCFNDDEFEKTIKSLEKSGNRNFDVIHLH